MATDLKWLQGRIAENPKEERKDLDRLLTGFLEALVSECEATEPKRQPESEAV